MKQPPSSRQGNNFSGT